MLVRASVREKEIAIRAAMGAGRRRLIMQMLSASVVLAMAGGNIPAGRAMRVDPIVAMAVR
jgi:hypothetical protein